MKATSEEIFIAHSLKEGTCTATGGTHLTKEFCLQAMHEYADQQTAELQSRYRELEGHADGLAKVVACGFMTMKGSEQLEAYRNFKAKEASNGR